MKKIVVDTYGVDGGLSTIIDGTVDAINNNKDLKVVLVGDVNAIKETLSSKVYDQSQIELVNALDYITNDESPTLAIKRKTESTLVKAYDYLKENDDTIALLSAGSTGAILTGAFLKIGRIKGISRPAMCPMLPTINGGQVFIMDCGANMDCKTVNLEHFAIMGNAYLKSVYGIERPRIALLSVGTESEKGNELTKEAHSRLKDMNINFVGNMESRDLLSGKYDLVVSDGFAGNVMLKSTEGAILSLLSLLKTEISKGFWSKVGALFMKKTFKKVKSTLDYNNHGGAVFIGCKKLVMKAHGSSKSTSIKICLEELYNMDKCNLIGKITEELSHINIESVE